MSYVVGPTTNLPFPDQQHADLTDLDSKATMTHLEEATGDLASEPVAVDTLLPRYSLIKSLFVYRTASLWALAVLAGALFDGYALVAPGTVMVNYEFIDKFGGPVVGGVKQLYAYQVAAWGGILNAGQILGMLLGSLTSDRFGRVFNIRLIGFLMVVSIILNLTMQNWLYYLFSRFLTGWATGLVQSGLTVYVSEISPPHIRSTMLFVYSIWYSVGAFVGIIAGQIITSTGAPYQHAFYSELVFLGLFVPALIFAPETPWFHGFRRNEAATKKSLVRLFGNVEGFDVDHEYLVIMAEVHKQDGMKAQSAARGYLALFKGVDRRRTWISFFPLIASQFIGLPLIGSGLPYYLSLLGTANPLIPSIASWVTTIGTMFVSAAIVNRVGRRPLLLGGILVSLIACLAIGGIGTKIRMSGGTLPAAGMGAIVGISVVWYTAFGLSTAPLSWAYLADTATPALRARTASIAAGLSAMPGLVFNYTTPILLSAQEANWGLELGYFYAGLSAIAVVVVFFTIPETQGRTFRELDELFERKTHTRKFKETTVDDVSNAVPASAA